MVESTVPQKTVTINETKSCCKSTQFASEFSPQLTGIIDPNEFIQSIDSINEARKETLCGKIALCIFVLGFGISLLLFGLRSIYDENPVVTIRLLSIGAVAIVASISIGAYVFKARLKRLRNAVNAESLKYSAKLPIPTKWIKIDIGDEVNSAIETDPLNPNGNLNEPSIV
ncbi:unnamed protein product [Adineta steineri]|uniref:Uncharacterized protein n=1 Tax=Adineta steineri TaxID=433720 RepID=A0A815HKF0_9BILA|nr:unnamed protein product [Adineta steineri]CAF3794664.1 unnamed protein product [Adineta steineri]